jgi:hypothetical protein
LQEDPLLIDEAPGKSLRSPAFRKGGRKDRTGRDRKSILTGNLGQSPGSFPHAPATPLIEALRSHELEAMLPRLVAYAARRLHRIGWAEGRNHIPAAGDAEDVVADAVEAALAGKHVWPDDMTSRLRRRPRGASASMTLQKCGRCGSRGAMLAQHQKREGLQCSIGMRSDGPRRSCSWP